MSLIVKDPKAPTPKSENERAVRQREKIYASRERIAGLIKRADQESLWDGIQAKDVDPAITEYVIEQMKAGFQPIQVRRQLGILRSTDKSWKKIVASIRQGLRIDSTAMFARWLNQNEQLSDNLQTILVNVTDALAAEKDEPIDPNLDEEQRKDAERDRRKRQSFIANQLANLSMSVDALSRLRQATVKMGKDLGVLSDPNDSKGQGGVTIIVKNNVGLPTREAIEVHQAGQREKNRELVDQAHVIATSGKRIPSDVDAES